MKLLLKKLFNLKQVIYLRNLINFRPVKINKKILNGNTSVSDSFCWRTDKGFKTIVKFSDIPFSFYNIENSYAEIIIFSKKNELIKKVQFEKINYLNELIISKESLNGVEDYGTFFIFHKFKNLSSSKISIANRCYLGFSKNENLYSFVHGNTLSRYVDMNNFTEIKSGLVQNSLFNYSTKYKVQNYLDEKCKNEIFLANPTQQDIKYKINNDKRVLKNGESIIIDLFSANTISIESSCLFLRPIIFSTDNDYIDVYHG